MATKMSDSAAQAAVSAITVAVGPVPVAAAAAEAVEVAGTAVVDDSNEDIITRVVLAAVPHSYTCIYLLCCCCCCCCCFCVTGIRG